MSVLACSREGCRNIMCDRYSFRHGYICHECYDELVEYLTQKGMHDHCSIDIFMNTSREELNIDTEFSRRVRDILDDEFAIT